MITVDDVFKVVAVLNDEVERYEGQRTFVDTPLLATFEGSSLKITLFGETIWDSDDIGLALPSADEDPDDDDDATDYDSDSDVDSYADLERHIRKEIHLYLESISRGVTSVVPLPQKRPTRSPRSRSLEILVRGTRGAGKTTVAQVIAAELSKWGLKVEVDDPEISLPMPAAQCAQSLAGLQSVGTDVLVKTENIPRE